MTYRITNTLQHNPARVAGFMFLFTMATSIFSAITRSDFIVSGNAAANSQKYYG